jgi:hypothetical protein
MANHDAEFILILKHTVRIARRTGFTKTAMGDRRTTGETQVTAAASVYFDYTAGGKVTKQSGDFVMRDGLVFMRFDQDVQEGDYLYPVVGPVGFTMMEAIDVKPVHDFDGLTHHVEVSVRKIG